MKEEFLPLDPKLLADILTDEVFHDLIQNDGRLTGEPLLKIWRRMEMQGDPPAYMEIMVRRNDVERLIKKLKREKKLAQRAQRAGGSRA